MEKIGIILAEGFEEIEAVTIIDVLRRANLTVLAVGLDNLKVTGAHAITVTADCVLTDLRGQILAGVILPGGLPGTKNLLASPELIDFLQQHAKAGKVTAAICAAPWVLAKANLLTAKQATIYPGMEDKLSTATASPERVVEDGMVITSKGPGTAMDFALTLVTKFTNAAKANQVAQGLLFT